MAVIRISGELAACADSSHHFSICHFAFHCDFLPGDVARVQALQGVQHDCQRHQDRGGRGARRHRPLLHRGDPLHHLVHFRATRQIPLMSKQIRLRQRHHEHDRPHRHHTLLHHPGHHRGGKGGGHSPKGTLPIKGEAVAAFAFA